MRHCEKCGRLDLWERWVFPEDEKSDPRWSCAECDGRDYVLVEVSVEEFESLREDDAAQG